MNIAVVVGIYKYSAHHEITAPQKDAVRIKKLLEATGKYQEILDITENTNAANIKKEIRSFFEKFINNEIKEVFYYFSGHGIFEDQEFYMLCSDYEKSKLNMTSLQNSEIDDFIRLLKPNLTVKIIDACFSGYRYLKKDLLFDNNSNVLSRHNFENFIFMASSHDNQASQMMMDISYFTEKFIEGALSSEIGGKVLYRDIQAYIADEFRTMSTQNPFFVIQGTGTEVFSEYTDKMQIIKKDWYPKPNQELIDENLLMEEKRNTTIPLMSTSNNSLVESLKIFLSNQDVLFVDESIIIESLENITKSISDYQINDDVVSSFYKLSLICDKKLYELTRSDELLRIAYKQKWPQKYFVKIETETVTETISSQERQLLGFDLLGLKGLNRQETREVQKPSNLESLHSLPFEVIWIEFKPEKHLLLSPIIAIIALVHSETHVLALYHCSPMMKTNWRSFEVDWNSVKWKLHKFLWKDIVDNDKILWESFLINTIQEIRENLIGLLLDNNLNT